MIDPRLPRPKIREEFRHELRARLMAEAVTALAPRLRGTAWAFLRPTMGVGLAAVLLVAGAGTAAANSVSGEAAFPLKRALEDLQVNFTFDDVQRVELLSQLADRRLAELKKVAEDNDETKEPAASEEFAAALTRFRSAVDAIQKAAPADTSAKVQELVDAARGKHGAVLDEVQQKLDSETARQAIERAKANEDQDTQSENTNNEQGRTPRPARTPTPARTPRPTERAAETPRSTRAPLATQRTDNSRGTPRPTENADGGD